VEDGGIVMSRLSKVKFVVIGLLAAVMCTMGGVQAFAQNASINVIAVQDPFFFAIEQLLPDFQKATGIKVNLEGMAWDALQARLTTSFITKDPGVDVVNVDDCRLAQFAENTWIVPITDFIRKDKKEVKMNEFIPQIIYSACTWRGEVYTLPVAMYVQNVIYRTDLLQKAGLKAPPTKFEDWWTWDKYMEYVKAFKDLGPDVYGTVIVGAISAPVVHMYTGLEVSRGVRWFKQFPQAPWDFTPTINTPESVATLEFYQELYKNSPPEAVNYLWFDAGVAFSTKDIGMFYWWSPYDYLIQQAGYMVAEPSKNLGKYGYAVMPIQPGAEKMYSVGGHGLAIPQFSDKKDAAWKFIKWATSADTQKKMALLKLKAFSDFSREPLFKDKELQKYYPWLDVQLYMSKYSDGKVSRPHMVLYPTMEGFYGLEINKVLAGQLTASDAMKEAQQQFEIILKQNYYLPFQGKSYDDSVQKAVELIKTLSP
jgi:multiple sugar transport system substrate-binding protein